MRVASTVVSLTTHAIVVLAAVWSTTTARPNPPRKLPVIALPRLADPSRRPSAPELPVPIIDGDVSLPPIDVRPVVLTDDIDARTPRFQVDPGTASGPLFAGTLEGDGSAVDPSLVDELPMLLVGPHPAYPELLRQAGLQGRVVLEAVIDTLGRVEQSSVVVVESAHPSFVAPAQQSLLKSLFRPARVRGKAVRVRVRVPIDFVLRDGRLKG